MFEMTFAASSETRVHAVEEAIDYIAQEMVKVRHAYQDKSEDELTIYIIGYLKSMGFRASHDTQYGGHCDIVVEGPDEFLWLAEAKKHSAYPWLIDGIKQLTTRYATGLRSQDAGDLLIYHYGQRADLMITEWESHLRRAYPSLRIERCERNDQVIRSVHLHDGTGRPFKVRHVTIPLYFSPEK
jgi:hypothetical protein